MGTLLGCQPPSEVEKPTQKQEPEAGKTLDTGITLQKLDQTGSVALSDFRGKPLLIYFTAVWTDNSAATIDQIQALGDTETEILPVLMDKRAIGEIRSNISETLIEQGACSGTEELLSQIGPIRALPTVVLLDSHGKLLKKWPGFVASETIIMEMSKLTK